MLHSGKSGKTLDTRMETHNKSTLSGPAPLGLATLHSCNHLRVNSGGRSAMHRAGCGMEIWKAIPGHEGRYEISNQATVRSLRNHCGLRKKPLIMSQHNISGYIRVSLWTGTRQETHRISRLLLLAFVGEPPSNRHEAAHNNGIKTDNRLSNLRWATPKENCADKVLHGTICCGEKHYKSKLDARTAKEIFTRSKTEACSELAKELGVAYQTVWSVASGKTWRSINER